MTNKKYEVQPRLYYIQAIVRNRLTEAGFYYPEAGALELLIEAHKAGVPMDKLEDLAKWPLARTWTQFRDLVCAEMRTVN